MKQKLKEAIESNNRCISKFFDYVDKHNEEPVEILEQAAQDLLAIVYDFEGSDDEVLLNAYTILEKYTDNK